MKNAIPYVFLLSCSTILLHAQSNLGARLTAMANNGAAVKDVWSAQANIAGIIGIKTTSAAINYTKNLFINSLNTQSAVLVHPFGANYVGLSLQRYGITDYNEIKAGFAYAKKFGEQFSIGINANYHQVKITNYGATTGFSVDVGLLYQLNSQIILGAYTSNPAQQKYNSTNVNIAIPSLINIGASYQASDRVLLATTVTKNFNAAIDVSIGLDYKMLNLFSLRAGLSAKPFKQYVGFGLNYKKYLLDMALTKDPNLGYSPQIALGYAF